MNRPPADDDLEDLFDGIYADAGRDDAAVPWQRAASREVVGRWLEQLDPSAHRRALVVAAGLGDDAAALARLGLDVVAFDRSTVAVEWAQERHPDVTVAWEVADLFDPPAEWTAAFDLVLEVFTIQSVAPEDQERAAATIAGFVQPGGTLVAVAIVREPGTEPSGPPWPLDPRTLDDLEQERDGWRGMVRTGGEETPLGQVPGPGGGESPLGHGTRLVRRDLRRH